MADIVNVLKSQHRTFERLLEKAQQEDSDTLAVLQDLHALLKPHSDAEEAFVYPRIVELQSDEASEVKDGTAEHHHAAQALAELLAEDPDGPGYDGKLAALAGELQHHIEEEEDELLPVLSDKADKDERAQLGERFESETGTAGGAESSEATRAELYERAKAADIPGRSQMTKDELSTALTRREPSLDSAPSRSQPR